MIKTYGGGILADNTNASSIKDAIIQLIDLWKMELYQQSHQIKYMSNLRQDVWLINTLKWSINR